MTHSVTGNRSFHGVFHATTDIAAIARSIVVPFYNEEGCVQSVLSEIRAAQPLAEIIAVDDGSKDRTWAVDHCYSRDQRSPPR
jgi:hypothetical protein